MPDREHRDDEHLAVGLADVLREERRGLGGDAELRPLGELHAGLADQGDPEAGDAVRPGWVRGRHGVTLRRTGGGGLSLRPRPALQAEASALRYSSRIHAFTRLIGSAVPSTARR